MCDAVDEVIVANIQVSPFRCCHVPQKHKHQETVYSFPKNNLILMFLFVQNERGSRKEFAKLPCGKTIKTLIEK
jgi:hypothetical protein